MALVTPVTRRNLWEAFDAAVVWLAGWGVTGDWARQFLVRLCFAIRSESYGGFNMGNDGRNTSGSPSMTANRVELLRRTLDPEWLAEHGLQVDKVGSNGRSTGILQQISDDVGGDWGPMEDTLRPAAAAVMFLRRLRVTENPVYRGQLVQPDGSTRLVDVQLTAVAADVLRVQQPLADEAESANYSADKVAAAEAVVAMYLAEQKPAARSASWWARVMHWSAA